MLKIERLECENQQFHKNCEWVNVRVAYPDTQYLLLRDRLIREVKRTNIAYRILHNRFGILATLKLGHDGILWVGEHEDALRRFALIPAERF